MYLLKCEHDIGKERERYVFALSKVDIAYTHTFKPDKFRHLHIRNGYFIYPGGIFISAVVFVIFLFFVSVFCLLAFWWMVLFVDHQ